MKSFKDKVILITGGSTGLGLALAREFAREGAVLALCARDEVDLEYTRVELRALGARVFTSTCDVSKPQDVEAFVEAVLAHYGTIDVVINNAGVIYVGAMESFDLPDFEAAMDIMYWGVVHVTRAVLPHFKGKNAGHFVNVTSIGGIVAIPQLLPYVSAKFAATGFSLGLAAELKKDKITVTTIAPGLMRTGSYVNARFQKGNRKEFKLFSAMSTTPGITISTDAAVRKILRAIRQRKVLAVLGAPARIIRSLYHFAPGTLVRLFGIMNRFIPAREGTPEFVSGESIRSHYPHAELPYLERIGEKVRERFQHSDEKTVSRRTI